MIIFNILKKIAKSEQNGKKMANFNKKLKLHNESNVFLKMISRAKISVIRSHYW